MKKITHGLLITLFFFLLGAQPTERSWDGSADEQNTVRFMVDVPSNLQVRDVAATLQREQYDIPGVDMLNRTVEVITTRAGVEYLKSLGLSGTEKLVSRDGRTLPDAGFMNPAESEARLRKIASTYPKWTRLEEIGRTLEGRPILALLVSSTPAVNSPEAAKKPVILMDALHHAREVMTPEIVADAAETILGKASAGDAQATSILNNWMVWLIPMVNPDGSNRVWTSSALWRKNVHAESFMPYGVDINRNYSFEWNACGGSSGTKSAQDYRGPSAGSELETQAIMNFARRIHPNINLSYHSYSELVLYPYGCNGELTGENALHKKVAEELSAILPRDDGKAGYETGTPWQILYSTDGDSISFMQSEFGALSFVFEVNQSFQPSYTLTQPTVAKHRNAWMHVLERSFKNMLTLKLVDQVTGLPLDAVVQISTIQHAHGEKEFRPNSAGYFFKILDAGNYEITVTNQKTTKSQKLNVNMTGQPQNIEIKL